MKKTYLGILFLITIFSFSFSDDIHFGIDGAMYPNVQKVGREKIKLATKKMSVLGNIPMRVLYNNGISWAEVEPKQDVWNFNQHDAMLDGNTHPLIFTVYGSMGTPYHFDVIKNKNTTFREYLEKMADNKGARAVKKYIRTLMLDFNNSKQRRDVKEYVKKFVGRYKDRVKYWEIGNEGITSKDRFDIIKYTATWIREVYPEAQILITAVAGDDEATYQRGLNALDKLLAQGAGKYFDIANIHYYEKTDSNLETKIENAYDRYKSILDKYGVNKPIWVTETSTSSYERSPLSGPGSEKIQARDLVKRFVIFAAKGADKIFWHKYRHTALNNKFHGCNLVNKKTGPKPAYYTFKLLVDKVGDYKTVETLKRGNVWLYKFVTDKPVFVAWSRSNQTIDLSGYTDAQKLRVINIVESKGERPKASEQSASAIKISPSPVIIQ